MPKEYKDFKDRKEYEQSAVPPQNKPPKKDNRAVILLSVILVLLLAIITAVVVIFSTKKSEEKNDGSTTQNTSAQEQGTVAKDPMLKPGIDADMPSFPEGQTGESVTDTSSTAPSQTLASGENTPNTAPSTPSGGSNSGGSTPSGGGKPAQLTKADVIRFFNEETAKAAKGSYELTRTGAYTKAVNVGNATDALNKIIKGVDKNADINSVVSSFLGIGKEPIKAAVKNGKAEGVDSKYMLKAMSLTDADVIDFAVNGNKYTVQIANSKVPNTVNPMSYATNDYFTFAEANKDINALVGNAVRIDEADSYSNYTKIIFTATVADGKITNLEYSYTLNAKFVLELVVMKANGTCEAEIKGSYANIRY